MNKNWKSSITTSVDGKPHLYGYDLTQMAGNYSFSDTIYLALTGNLPDQPSSKMFESILTIAIDHGIETPSAVAARIVYSGGNSVNTAVAAGVMALGEWHGGAIEKSMEIISKAAADNTDASDLVNNFKAKGERVAGFGHRLYDVDPRTQRLLEIAHELGFKGKYVAKALEIEAALSSESKALPLNIDGIIAALLLEMGLDQKVGKGVFIIARTPGLVAHVVEEAIKEKPFRRLSEEEVEYDGPRPRELPKNKN